jgi:Protein of unknown function (DUF993)
VSATGTALRLPRPGGRLEDYTPGPAGAFDPPPGPPRSRVCFAAAHVVRDPLADGDPTLTAALDWEATLAYRRHLWRYGFAVAEAMDTAQRGAGLDWAATAELIRRSAAEARAAGGAIACGAGTDQLPADREPTLDDVRAAYAEQCALVEGAGSPVILMASRALARCARGPDDYRAIYGELLGQLREPAIIHWLGEQFDPALRGYWGAVDVDEASEVLLSILAEHAERIDGVKVSLLDAEREVALRRRFPPGVRMYTGDDFDYPSLIRGDSEGYSDALLGIFDAIAPAAAAALVALDAGDLERYDAILAPTVALARHIFKAPTYHYKTGIVFLAYLNGHQDHCLMVGGQEGARSTLHLAELFVLAGEAGLLRDPELAVARMRRVLALAGIEG